MLWLSVRTGTVAQRPLSMGHLTFPWNQWSSVQWKTLLANDVPKGTWTSRRSRPPGGKNLQRRRWPLEGERDLWNLGVLKEGLESKAGGKYREEEKGEVEQVVQTGNLLPNVVLEEEKRSGRVISGRCSWEAIRGEDLPSGYRTSRGGLEVLL